MGVQDLSKELRASKKLVSSLSVFNGKTLGVDASIWLNKAIFSSPEISVLFHQEPRVSVGHLIDQYFNSLYSIFEANSIKILFVIDGARNPLKAATNETRKKRSTDAANEVLELIQSGDQEHLKRITALKKKAVYVREDILAYFVRFCIRKGIRYVCAFMEAEWELCKLEMDGVIDAVVSEDSDCFVLGCKVMIQLLDKDLPPLGLNCSAVTGSQWYDYVNNILPNPSTSELADFAVLLGVDYLNRAYGNSVNKVKGFFVDWRTRKEEILCQIESAGQVQPKRSRAGIPGYKKIFMESSNIFQYAPCYCIESVIEGETLCQSFWGNNYRVKRGNLRDLPDGADEAILFGFNPDDILPSQFPLMDLFTMKIWIRTKCSIDDFIVPFPKNDKNEILPWGCNLDFEKVPISMQPTVTLISYLECRGLSPRSSNTRSQLISAVERVVSQGERGPAILPCSDIVGGGHYVNLEVLTCNEPIIWEVNGNTIFGQIKNLTTSFNEAFINQHFSDGCNGPRNGVRERAWGRVNGGHFDLLTIKSTVCNCRTPEGIESVRMFSIKCSPSMKKDVYTIYLVMRKSDDKFIPAPGSRCNCPVGRLFCSHLLAFIVLLGMIQTSKTTEDFEWFVENMPEPVKSLHSLCIPFAYVF
jgi:5'-3' exonuclease